MAKPLAKLATEVQASTTMVIDALFKQMRADGVDVIGFGAGEPDFNTPDFVKEAGIDAIRKNLTRYTPSGGTESLRKAICARLQADFGLTYTPSQILVSSGAKHNLYLALRTLVDPGDEVILPAPYWVSYDEQIRMVGGRSVVVYTQAAANFKMTPEQLEAVITPKTKALMLNSPSNPTGMVYSREELKALADICVKNEIYIIADEIYSHLVYGQEFYSIASLSEEIKAITILINGVSKTYAMTGWRVGYAAAPLPIATVMTNFQSHSTSAPCTIAQAAAEAALSGPQDCVEEMREAFEQRRNAFIARAAAIPGITCLEPHGAFYVMVDVSSAFGKTVDGVLIRSANDFAQILLQKALVAVVPCDGFAAPEYVRMSYAVSETVIEEGLNRLETFMKAL